MSIHSICFRGEIRKILFQNPLLPGAMIRTVRSYGVGIFRVISSKVLRKLLRKKVLYLRGNGYTFKGRNFCCLLYLPRVLVVKVNPLKTE